MRSELVFVIVFLAGVFVAFLVLLAAGAKAEDKIYGPMRRRNDRLRDEINQTAFRLHHQQGYHISKKHAYDLVKTDSGFDVVLHFVKEDAP